MSEDKKPARIYDVDINRAAVKKASTLEEFKKLNPNIFDHLAENESAAYELLFKEFGTALAASKVAPVANP